MRYTVRCRVRVVRDAPDAMSVALRLRPDVELVSRTVATGHGDGARRAHERTYRRLPEHLQP